MLYSYTGLQGVPTYTGPILPRALSTVWQTGVMLYTYTGCPQLYRVSPPPGPKPHYSVPIHAYRVSLYMHTGCPYTCIQGVPALYSGVLMVLLWAIA